MEDIIRSIEKMCSCDSERKSQYKFNSRGGNRARDIRREELLDRLRRRRDALLKEKRGFLKDEFNENEEEEWMDWQESKKSFRKKWINQSIQNQLMLSEWLLDRPYDLDTEWSCILCPEGRRTIVVAKKGCTRAYQKSGHLLAKFKSILPSGSPSTRGKNSEKVILDCIWNETTKKLYALDVMFWKNQTLLDCDAQFRLYWLKTKFQEIGFENQTEDMQHIFLPSHCRFFELYETLKVTNPFEVDGILFYHNKAPYVSGQTPLVGWLKPFMLQERFDMAVPTGHLALRPDNYVDLEQWVELYSHDHKRKFKKNKQKKNEKTHLNNAQTQKQNGCCEREEDRSIVMETA